MVGSVIDENGEALIGANVVAIHQPSGTSYGTATDENGDYRFPGMRVGGPYKITVSYTGFAEQILDNIILRLGESQERDFTLQQTSTTLGAIMVVAQAGVAGQNSGTSTQITSDDIEIMPSLNRGIADFLKLTPQGSIFGDGITFAGTNNRYNAIFIDGAVNNDVFGISSSGTNGGQTGISPFSIDIIDQFQVSVSPYDVSLGGFAGAGINAVTKSGTNTVSGTAYYFLQNESLAGKTNGERIKKLGLQDSDRTKLAEYSQGIYGASLGGPIARDKVFFFANVEIQDDETPLPFEFEEYSATAGRYTTAQLDGLRNFLISEYGYDPGGYLSTSDKLEGLKLFGKLDINLSGNHRLTLRHQYTKAEQTDRFAGSSNTINFSNNGIYFPSTTNSSALELNSRFGTKTSNNLILGFTRVNDDRDAIGQDFPYVFIEDVATGLLRFGTEEFSTANQLKTNIITLTDNFKIYGRNHTLTLGTHNEFYDIYNAFIGQNFGTYRYSTLQDFLDNAPAKEYDRAYSLVDDITGDGTAAAADFKAMQLGFYVQDEWTVTNKFTLTGGVRLDIPIITDDPVGDSYFNPTALPKFQARYEIAKDIEGGKAPEGQLMFSPRLGFDFDINDDRSFVLRGGLGVFTSRIPFVWPGAIFSNNGLILGRVDENNIDDVFFIADVNNQYVNPNFAVPTGQIDIFVKDFKYPQVFRTNLAVDKVFGGGWKVTLEGLYTDKINDVIYANVNSNPDVKFNFTNNGGDTRPVYVNTNLDATYSAVYVGYNTDRGYSYNLTGALSKDFPFGLSTYLAYTYGDSYSINDGTSSQNSSQWRGQVSVDGRNFPAYGRSDYALTHRFVTSLNYKQKWSKDGGFATNVGLFFNAQSGAAFSYMIGGGSSAQNINGERGSTSRNRNLAYIPIDENDINLVDYTVSGTTVTAAQQWANLNALIEDDESLNENRGKYAEKNGATAPMVSLFDLAIRQDLGTKIGNSLNRIQVSLDIFNVANLLNKDWGVVYTVPGSDFNNYYLYNFEGYATDGTTPRFTYRGTATGKDKFDIANTASRWRMRVGLRYTFN